MTKEDLKILTNCHCCQLQYWVLIVKVFDFCVLKSEYKNRCIYGVIILWIKLAVVVACWRGIKSIHVNAIWTSPTQVYPKPNHTFTTPLESSSRKTCTERELLASACTRCINWFYLHLWFRHANFVIPSRWSKICQGHSESHVRKLMLFCQYVVLSSG